MAAPGDNALGEEMVSTKVLTVPNIISFARLCLVPVYFATLLSGCNIAATLIFAFAAATDFVDGQVARRTHSVSKLGKLLDPSSSARCRCGSWCSSSHASCSCS